MVVDASPEVSVKPYGLKRLNLEDPLVKPQQEDKAFAFEKMREAGIVFHPDIEGFPISVSDEVKARAIEASPYAQFFVTFLETPFMEYPDTVSTVGNEGIRDFESKFFASIVVNPNSITDNDITQFESKVTQVKEAAAQKPKFPWNWSEMIASLDHDSLSDDTKRILVADAISERRYLAADKVLNQNNRWKANAFRDVLSVIPLLLEEDVPAEERTLPEEIRADITRIAELLPRISPNLEAGENSSDFYKELPKEDKLRIQKQYAKAAECVLNILGGEGISNEDVDVIKSLRVPVGEERRKLRGMP